MAKPSSNSASALRGAAGKKAVTPATTHAANGAGKKAQPVGGAGGSRGVSPASGAGKKTNGGKKHASACVIA